jgi:hypothetical protein
LYALAGILQWHLETKLNAMTGALLLLSAACLLWTPLGLIFHVAGAAMLIGVILFQWRSIRH